MNISSSRGRRVKRSGLMVIILLSFLSLELVILSGGHIGKWENVFADLFMKWRSTLAYSGEGAGTDNIVLLAIDERTKNDLGRYGAGRWISRDPFVQNIKHLFSHYKPSVLAYDLTFVNDLGLEAGEDNDRISESPEKLSHLVDSITGDLSQGAESIPQSALLDMNRLVVEMGNKTFADVCAEAQQENMFDVLFGCYFRGGGVDPQSVIIDGWSDWDIFGDSEDGNEDMGARLPYLNDLAIPSENIKFSSSSKANRYEPSPNATLPMISLLDYGYIGPLNIPRDEDGVVRRVPMVLNYFSRNTRTHVLKESFMPSFSLMAAMLHLGMEFPIKKGDVDVVFGEHIVLNIPDGGKYVIPVDEKGRLYLNYDNRFSNFPELSFSKFYSEGIDYKDVVDERVALVGLTLTGMDVGATPLHSNIPLVFVQMTAINNILTQRFITPVRGIQLVALWLVVFVLVTVISHYEKTFKLGPALFLFGVLYFIVGYTFIHKGWCVLPVVQPLFYIGVSAFSILSFRFFTEEKDKRKIRGMFSTMVSGKVLNYMEENPQSFSIQGRNVDATVFFSDVEAFTSISESLPPEKLTDLLNAYLTPVTDCIMNYDGYLDKYMGDGIMAVWGAPNPDPNHAISACLSALEQQSMIEAMNSELTRDYGSSLNVRMGVNSGVVTAGNMGSAKKFQYTVMGDVVNLAARLEPVNKDFSTKIIISESTYRAVTEKLVTRKLEEIVVQGKKESVSIYELIGKRGDVTQEIIDVTVLYEKALAHFHLKQWVDAIALAEKAFAVNQDPASEYLIKRADEYRKHPPPENWKGEYVRVLKY